MTTAPVRPPMPYFGGKIRIAPRLVALMSTIPHAHYVEPYCGSLAVLLAKPPVCHETVNDLDGALVTFWRVLRDRRDDLVRVCSLTPHSRVEHQQAYALDDLDELEVARRVWVQLTQGRAGRRTNTGWRHYQDPKSCSTGLPGYLDGYVGRMHPAVDRLHRVSLECRPALDLVQDFGRHPGVLLYVDPPYPSSVRRNGDPRYRGARDYVVEMQTEAEHRELADALHACRAAVVLSGYPSPLYDQDLYASWSRVEIPTATGQGGTWESRTEVVWSNRDIGDRDLLDLLAEDAAS